MRCSESPGGHSGAQSTRTNGTTSVRPVWLVPPRLHPAVAPVARLRGEGQGWGHAQSPRGLPGDYALGANINKGSRKGVLIPDLTTKLLHMREISGPQTVSIPRPSSLSNLLLLLILTGFSQPGGRGRQRRRRYRETGSEVIWKRFWAGWKHTHIHPDAFYTLPPTSLHSPRASPPCFLHLLFPSPPSVPPQLPPFCSSLPPPRNTV